MTTFQSPFFFFLSSRTNCPFHSLKTREHVCLQFLYTGTLLQLKSLLSSKVILVSWHFFESKCALCYVICWSFSEARNNSLESGFLSYEFLKTFYRIISCLKKHPYNICSKAAGNLYSVSDCTKCACLCCKVS